MTRARISHIFLSHVYEILRRKVKKSIMFMIYFWFSKVIMFSSSVCVYMDNRRVTGRATRIIPKAPPVIYSRPAPNIPTASTTTTDEQNQSACPVCLTDARDLAFGCGHMTCRDCASKLSHCPICRVRITSRLRVYTGWWCCTIELRKSTWISYKLT